MVSLLLAPCAVPGDPATKVKILNDGIFCDVTSTVRCWISSDLTAAQGGSFTRPSPFSRACVAVIPASTGLPTPPLCTRDTNKKKQRSKSHIHIAKLVYLYTHNPAVITIY